jgi:hypothetical protein
MDVELATVRQDQRAQRRHRFGRRPDVGDGVALPRRAGIVDRPGPDVDHGFALDDHRDGRPDVEAPIEVGGQGVPHRGELVVASAMDLGHGTSPGRGLGGTLVARP